MSSKFVVCVCLFVDGGDCFHGARIYKITAWMAPIPSQISIFGVFSSHRYPIHPILVYDATYIHSKFESNIQVFHSLQKLRHNSRRKSELEKTANENGHQGDMNQKRRKKKAPEPPRFVRIPLGSPKKSKESSPGKNMSLEGATTVLKVGTENEYEGTPRRPLQHSRPPQPAPRMSKLPQTLPSEEEDESEEEDDEDEEDDDEEEEEDGDEEEDLEEVKNRVQNQYYNKQTLTLVEGKQDICQERVDKVEDENEEFSEESTLHERCNDDTKEPKSESEWDSEEEAMEAEIENIEMNEEDNEEENEEREVEEEIRLRKPTPGSKIADLTNIIEAQLHSRAAR